MRVRAWVGGVALALLLAASPAPGAPRGQVVPVADARLRLEVWGQELAGARGAIAAHSARRVAWVADHQGTMIEALFLVALQEAGASGRLDQCPRHPRWVRCALPEVGSRWRGSKASVALHGQRRRCPLDQQAVSGAGV